MVRTARSGSFRTRPMVMFPCSTPSPPADANARDGSNLADAVVGVAALTHRLLQARRDGVDQRGAIGFLQLGSVSDAGIVAADDLLVMPVPGEIGSQRKGAQQEDGERDAEELS